MDGRRDSVELVGDEEPTLSNTGSVVLVANDSADAEADFMTAVKKQKEKEEQMKALTPQPNLNGQDNKHVRASTVDDMNKSHARRPSVSDVTNMQAISMIGMQLRPAQRKNLERLSNDLRTERDLKHALERLKEVEGQLATAVEIIGSLEREVSEWKETCELSKMEASQAATETRILNNRIQTMEEVFHEETQRNKETIEELTQQLEEMTADVEDKNFALHQAHEELHKSMQSGNIASVVKNSARNVLKSPKGNNSPSMSPQKIAKLVKDYENLKKLQSEKDVEFLSKLEELERCKGERDELMKELQRLSDEVNNDYQNQEETQRRMADEVISLASANSALERERDDLIDLLEQRDYETEMLKQQLEMLQNAVDDGLEEVDVDEVKVGAAGKEWSRNSARLSIRENVAGDMLTEMMSSKEYEGEFVGVDGGKFDVGELKEEEEEDEKDLNDLGLKSKYKKDQKKKDTPDVIREYLHIAASAILIKHPKVRDIASNELIQKVRGYGFEEYYDQMLKIVKLEEKKLLKKEKVKAEQQALLRKQQAQNKKKPGLLSNFFSKFAKTHDEYGRNRKQSNSEVRDRHKSVPGTASATATGARTTAGEKNTKPPATGRFRGGSTSRQAPKAPVGKSMKNGVQSQSVTGYLKKMQGKHTDDEIKEQSNLDFVSIASPRKKAAKPSEKL